MNILELLIKIKKKILKKWLEFKRQLENNFVKIKTMYEFLYALDPVMASNSIANNPIPTEGEIIAEWECQTQVG